MPRPKWEPDEKHRRKAAALKRLAKRREDIDRQYRDALLRLIDDDNAQISWLAYQLETERKTLYRQLELARSERDTRQGAIDGPQES